MGESVAMLGFGLCGSWHVRGGCGTATGRGHVTAVCAATRSGSRRVRPRFAVRCQAEATLTETQSELLKDEKAPVEKEAGLEPRKLLAEVRVLANMYWFGEKARSAWLWSALTVLMALVKTVYVGWLSFIQRTFYTALSKKDMALFQKMIRTYGMAVIIGPILVTIFDWLKERLSLKWREALTNRMLNKFMSDKRFYDIINLTEIDNPDQRLTEDIKLFAETAVQFLCTIFVTIFDFVVFSVILYKLYPPLFYVLLGYSTAGTLLTVILGRKLASLNRKQLVREADLRYSLVRVRENAESIAFFRGEVREGAVAKGRFWEARDNFSRLIGMKRNIGFLQRAYEYLPNLLPSLVVAPVYFKGSMELGAISQIYFSFNHVLGDLGVVVREFTSISAFSANVKRLSELRKCLENDVLLRPPGNNNISSSESDGDLVLNNVTIRTPVRPVRELTKGLSLQLKQSQRLLVVGESGIGKSSLLRVIAGLWNNGEGHVNVPPIEHSFFLPQRPYLILGSLKDNVAYPKDPTEISDEIVREALQRLNLPYIEEALGGLHRQHANLASRLSLGEQQRVGFARLLLSEAKFAILDESTSALDSDNERLMYGSIPTDVTVVSVSNRSSLEEFHDIMLRLGRNGSWSTKPL